MKFAKAYEPGEYEPEIYAAWEMNGTFLPKVREDAKRFSIVMPPPNANGNLHIGHGLTIALEDSMTRYARLKGEVAWYVPGADHAGFETWVVFERNLEKKGQTRFDYSRDELYAKVWDFVQEQRGSMELQLRALGASCSWKDLTFTLDENVVRRVYATFEKMWKEGRIYRGEKLVNYCPKHRTAFADIEVEHKEEAGYIWDIAYQYDGGEIIISTTRPETLFGDVAVAVNPEDERYRDLVGKKVKLPLVGREIPIIEDEHAEIGFGTGAVKITPAHDNDDFEVGLRHSLPRVTVIGLDGRMLENAGEYAGLAVDECRKRVLKDLSVAGLLRGEKKITRSVPHCYKCGTVIEPLLMDQWFVNTEKMAEEAIRHLENNEIKFYPESKKRVLINYLKNLKDWNISRQIPWGIAIPMFRKIDATEPGAEWIFDARTHLEEIEIAGVRYRRDNDTFDTWFSSAHWPIVCTNWEDEMPSPFYPLNVMETGADILFAWVARMVMMGLYVTGEVPFREVYLHGLVLDEHGQKMSKSKGNVINPMDLVSEYGSDAFRLGILRGRSAGMNQAFVKDTVVAGRNLCNKLWNVARLVQKLVDETPPESLTEYETLNMGEDWICRELNACRAGVEKAMREYRFSEAVEILYATIWDKYADWFMESQKLYRNNTLLMKTLETVLLMLHPFAPFVTEAIWQNLSWTEGLIVEEKWPEALKYDPISAENFARLIAVVTEIRGTLQKLPGGERWPVLYGDDSLLGDNADLVKVLTRVPEVKSTEGAPRGLRLALANNEVYLDVSEKVIAEYKETVEAKILAEGRQLDALNMRMMNPRYVEKAPAELVKETRLLIEEKTALIERLKQEMELI